MGGIRVVTDSACDLSEELAAAKGITVVPLTIRFGQEELLDRRDLTPEEFWRRCKGIEKLPETAAPAPGTFRSVFERLAAESAEGIVCVTMSSGVSATFQSARTAAEQVTGRIPVEVIDSRSVSMGQGLLALDAAEAAAAGSGFGELSDRVRARIPRTRVYGVVDTLEHLQKGGRIGGATALLGSLLSIKPVIEVRDGAVEQESRQRTRSRSIDYLARKAREEAPLDRLAVVSGDAADVGVLLSMLDDVEVAHPLIALDLGPVVGTHTGPGSLGLCFQVPARSSGPGS